MSQSEFGFSRRANVISRRAHRKRRVRLRVLNQRPLPMLDKNDFPAREGVPATRADCPKGGYCPHIRCRWHLARVDAEHRAGRPGLSNVKRDELGRTLRVEGDAGDERPGTTFEPRWRELERTCKVAVYWGEDGRTVEIEPIVPVNHETKPLFLFRKRMVGSWDVMRKRLHVGEPLEVYDETETRIATAYLMPDESIAFDRNPNAAAVYLHRTRPVPSCALDEIDRCGTMSNEQIGDAIGRHRTGVAREIESAIVKKAMVTAAKMGMSEADLLRGLREIGAGK
jgi:hypothetical protein